LIALEISKPRWFNPAGFFVLTAGKSEKKGWKKLCSLVPLLFNFCA
jgi:hypothetical protein